MGENGILVVGAGYVGLTTAACFAKLGHRVVCVDNDDRKVRDLRNGIVAILEPELEDLVAAGLRRGTLTFTDDLVAASHSADMVILCLPTPTLATGHTDLGALHAVAEVLGAHVGPGCTVVVKSTVPVGTADELTRRIGRTDVHVVSNPEFLREGLAVRDFLQPDRILVGCDDAGAGRKTAALYRMPSTPVVLTDRRTAEVAKYAANCYLAVRLSYINSVATLCELAGADVRQVASVMSLDPRIGPAHLRPGPGWGGSCLPKDTASFVTTAGTFGFDFGLLRAAIDFNVAHQERVAQRIRALAGPDSPRPRIGVLGLAFKAGTGDLRESPAVRIARRLCELGADVTASDPAFTGHLPPLTTTDDPCQAAKGAQVLAVLTEWDAFRNLDWRALAQLMEGTTVVDARGVLDRHAVEEAGLRCLGPVP